MKDKKFNYPLLIRCDLDEILPFIPLNVNQIDAMFVKYQGICKGIIERLHMTVGIGRRKDITVKMKAKLGIILNGNYPLLIYVNPSWSGKISSVRIYDVNLDQAGKIYLKVPFAPIRDPGHPRRLNLSLSHERERRENSEIAEMLIFKFEDLDTGEYIYRRLRLNYDRNSLTNSSLGSPEKKSFNAASSWLNVKHSTVSWKTLLRAPSNSNVAPIVDYPEPEEEIVPEESSSFIDEYLQNRLKNKLNVLKVGKAALNAQTAYRRMSIDEEIAGKLMKTMTNIVRAELMKGGYHWKLRYYLFRLSHSMETTQISLLHLKSSTRVVFVLKREHIDRSDDVRKLLNILMQLAESNSMTASILKGQYVTNALDIAFEKPFLLGDKLCFVDFANDGEGFVIALIDQEDKPIFSNSFETIDHDISHASLKKGFSFRTDKIHQFLEGNHKVRRGKHGRSSSSSAVNSPNDKGTPEQRRSSHNLIKQESEDSSHHPFSDADDEKDKILVPDIERKDEVPTISKVEVNENSVESQEVDTIYPAKALDFEDPALQIENNIQNIEVLDTVVSANEKVPIADEEESSLEINDEETKDIMEQPKDDDIQVVSQQEEELLQQELVIQDEGQIQQVQISEEIERVEREEERLRDEEILRQMWEEELMREQEEEEQRREDIRLRLEDERLRHERDAEKKRMQLQLEQEEHIRHEREDKQKKIEEERNKLLDEEKSRRKREQEEKLREKEEKRRQEEEFQRIQTELSETPYTVVKIKTNINNLPSLRNDVLTQRNKVVKRQPASTAMDGSASPLNLPSYALLSAEGLIRAISERDLFNSSTSVSSWTRESNSADSLISMRSEKSPGRSDAYKERYHAELLKLSTRGYKSMGFIDKKKPLPYANHWHRVVESYLMNTDVKKLKKSLIKLQRTTPVPLTVDESICALSDTDGNIGQVNERVKSIEYCSELKLASLAVNIKEILSQASHLSTLASGNSLVSLSSSGSMKAGSFSASSFHDETSSVDSDYSLRANIISELRMRSLEANSETLPHINISGHSPFVKSRAKFVAPVENVQDNNSVGSGARSTSSNRSSFVASARRLSQSPNVITPNRSSTPSKGFDSQNMHDILLNKIGVESLNQESTGKVSSSQLNREQLGSTNYNGFNLAGEIYGEVSGEAGFMQDDISLTSLSSSSSYRFGKRINAMYNDYKRSAPFAIIDRNSARKAQKDETLMRSEKVYVRSFVQKRADSMILNKSQSNL